MNTLPNHPLSVFQLLLATLSSYLKIFPHIIGLVTLSSIGHLIIPPLFLQNPALAGVATVGFILLTWFLFTAIIARAKVVLLGGKMKLREAFRLAKHRYLWMLGSNIVFFAIAAFLILITFALNLMFDLVHLHPVYLALSVILNVVIFVYLYFSIPEIALEKATTLRAFKQSIHLVRHHWWRTFIVLAVIGMAMLGFEALGILFTGKDRMMLFTAYHFVLQLLFYPLIISATILLLHDLKLRMERHI
jgi:hypothetical protein